MNDFKGKLFLSKQKSNMCRKNASFLILIKLMKN